MMFYSEFNANARIMLHSSIRYLIENKELQKIFNEKYYIYITYITYF